MTSTSAVFVTLTYNPEHYPEDGSLNKEHPKNFLKRLRKLIPYKIRFYSVGEYGTKTQRAHYHLIIFNMPFEQQSLDYLEKAWSLKGEPIGHVHVGDVTPASAGYVANYTTKKITGEAAEKHYNGRTPEFHSNSSGLGKDACKLIGELMAADKARHFIYEGCIRMNGRKYHLDDYMTDQISKVLYTETGQGFQKQNYKPTEAEHHENHKKATQRATLYLRNAQAKEKL